MWKQKTMATATAALWCEIFSQAVQGRITNLRNIISTQDYSCLLYFFFFLLCNGTDALTAMKLDETKLQ